MIDLKKLLQTEEFESWELNLTPHEIKKLLDANLIFVSYKSNKKTFYKPNKPLIEKILQSSNIELSGKLFENILHHNEHKEILQKCIENKISCLLYGPPSTAKTLFLLELKKLPNTIYYNFYLTAYELTQQIIEKPNWIFLIDQLDNVKDKKVYNVLIDALEYGNVMIDTYQNKLYTKFEGCFIATANNLKRIPEPLKTRFLILRFRPYTEEQYIELCKNLLKQYNNNENIINKIIEITIEKRDIRNAIKLAKLCKSIEEIEKYKKVLLL